MQKIKLTYARRGPTRNFRYIFALMIVVVSIGYLNWIPIKTYVFAVSDYNKCGQFEYAANTELFQHRSQLAGPAVGVPTKMVSKSWTFGTDFYIANPVWLEFSRRHKLAIATNEPIVFMHFRQGKNSKPKLVVVSISNERIPVVPVHSYGNDGYVAMICLRTTIMTRKWSTFEYCEQVDHLPFFAQSLDSQRIMAGELAPNDSDFELFAAMGKKVCKIVGTLADDGAKVNWRIFDYLQNSGVLAQENESRTGPGK